MDIQRTICAMSRIAAAFFLLVSLTGADTDALAATAAEPPKMTIISEPLGDSGQAIVIRFTFRFGIPQDVPGGVPLILNGALTQSGMSTKTFRYTLAPSHPDTLSAIQTLAPGEAEIEARRLVPLEESAPVILPTETGNI